MRALNVLVVAVAVACAPTRPPATIAEVPPRPERVERIPDPEAPSAPLTIPEVTPSPAPPPVPEVTEPPRPSRPRPTPVPKPAPPPPVDLDALRACTTHADCAIDCPDVAGCCGSPCGCRTAVRRDAHEAWVAHYTATCDRAPCPIVGCAYEPASFAACVEGRCVARDGPAW